MRASVRARWVTENSRWEARVPFMYLDVKCLVTTGVGNLINTVEQACALLWRRGDGSFASRDEIAAEWHRVASRTDLAPRGGMAFAASAVLHLDAAAIDALVLGKLAANGAYLAHRFPEFEAWPADAQFGTLSLSWADGPAFDFPRFEAAARARDWAACSIECHMNEAGNRGLHPRNLADAVCFMNAAAVDMMGADPEELHFPEQLAIPTPAPASTLPELGEVFPAGSDDGTAAG